MTDVESFLGDLLSKIEAIRSEVKDIRDYADHNEPSNIVLSLEVISRTVNQIEADLLKLDVSIDFEETTFRTHSHAPVPPSEV